MGIVNQVAGLITEDPNVINEVYFRTIELPAGLAKNPTGYKKLYEQLGSRLRQFPTEMQTHHGKFGFFVSREFKRYARVTLASERLIEAVYKKVKTLYGDIEKWLPGLEVNGLREQEPYQNFGYLESDSGGQLFTIDIDKINADFWKASRYANDISKHIQTNYIGDPS